jgi:hypothetical protein
MITYTEHLSIKTLAALAPIVSKASKEDAFALANWAEGKTDDLPSLLASIPAEVRTELERVRNEARAVS